MPAFQQSLSRISEVFDPPVADRIHFTQNNAHEDRGSGSGSAPEQLDGAFSRRRGPPPEARVPKAVHHSGSWSRQRVTMAYVGIFLVYFVTTAQVQISNHLMAYTMSRFGKHHLAPTAMSASNIAAAVLKLPISRVTDARGRTKVFVLTILATTLGLFSAFIARTASMFAIGQTTCWIGYDLISFILALSIADITLIRDRGWIFGLSSVPQLVNTYVGPLVAQSLQKGDHWRSTYGISACVLPLVSLPLSATLFDDSHKLAQATTQPIQSSVEETKPKLGWKRVLTVMKRVLVQDDFLGCLLIHSCAGMVLLPISLGVFSVKPSKAPHLTIELAIGICLFPALVVWERHQFTSRVTPLKALGQQTILGACLSGAAISASSACLDAYLLSYLQVVHNHTISKAGHLQNIYVAGSTFFAVCTGLSIRFHGKYTTLALVAAAFDILATGLAIIFRQSNASIWHIILNQLMLSFPGGTVGICGTVAVMAVVPHLETPRSLALFSLFTGLGAATGRAVAAALYINYMPKLLEQYLPVEAKPWVKVIFGSLHQQLSYPMGSAVRDGIIRAYVDFMRRACIFGLGFLPLAVFLASMWENVNVKDKDRKRPEVLLG